MKGEWPAGWIDTGATLPPNSDRVLLWAGEAAGVLVAWYDHARGKWRGQVTGAPPPTRGPWFWRPLPAAPRTVATAATHTLTVTAITNAPIDLVRDEQTSGQCAFWWCVRGFNHGGNCDRAPAC